MELIRKLQARGADPDLAAAAVADLERMGFQSDRRFAEAAVRKAVRRGQGINRLSLELRRQGAEIEGVREALGEIDWERLIEATYLKKYRGAAPASPRELAARIRFLSQRGFTQDQIRALFKRLGQTED
jgi:regulatory protein